MHNKRNPKKIVINVVLLLLLAFLLVPNIANAKILPGCEIPPKDTDIHKRIKINIPLPNVTESEVEASGSGDIRVYYVKDLPCFTIGIYTYLVGVIGILATVMIMYGGVKFLVSGGNPTRMSGAKDTIFSASVGLVLVLGAYILLNLINPNLTELRVDNLDPLQATVLPACTAQAVPDEDATAGVCGDTGSIGTGEQRVDCRYLDCTGGGEVCVPWDDSSNGYDCVNPIEGCKATNDVNLCDQFSIAGEGNCEFMILVGYDVGCYWLPEVNCPSGNWTQVSCASCLDAANPYKDTCTRDDGKCKSGSTQVYLYNWYMNTPDQYEDARICCQKLTNPTPDYPLGASICSDEHWYNDPGW